jgi:AraC family transcriptional regulator
VAALDDPRLRRAAAWIADHLAEDIALDALAAEAAMSPFHFARAFKAATGTSPLQYVIRARIEMAQAMLRSSTLSVAEIAHCVGYDDLSRFGQHFKRQVGATPAAWRAG